MDPFDRSHACNTNLSLGSGSVENSIGMSPEKDQEVSNNDLCLDLNLTLGEQTVKNCSSEECDMNNDNINVHGSRKKLRLSQEQSFVLEQSFKEHSTLNTEQKNSLASQLKLMPRQVEVWFQNRRARTKLKLTESDCERWKKGYQEIAEENKKLKLVIENLQASKRIKLDGQANFLEAPMNVGGDSVCPTCRRGWSIAGNNNRLIVLKPKPKYGGVKLSITEN